MDDRADWEVARARHVAYDERQPACAIEHLRSASRSLPARSRQLEAEAVSIEISTGKLPAEVPFEEIDLDALGRTDRMAVLLATSRWFLVQGRVREAAALLEERYSATQDDTRLDAVFIQTLYAMGRIAEGLQHARQLLAHARTEFDGSGFRAYSLLSAWGDVLQGNESRASHDVDTAVAVGSSPGEPPWAAIGLAMLNAYLALRNGDGDTARQLVAVTDGSDGVESSMTGFQRGFLVEKLAEAEGDVTEIEETAAIVGDSLWDRGARLAAATIYLESLRAEPDPEFWREIGPRVAAIDSPTVQRWVEFFDAVFAGKADAAVEIVRDSYSSSGPLTAARLATVGLMVFRNTDSANRDETAVAVLEGFERGDDARSGDTATRLTKRESEIAELVAVGFSNPMLAQALLVSVRTVQTHITTILAKIDSTERSEIRSYLSEQSKRVMTD